MEANDGMRLKDIKRGCLFFASRVVNVMNSSHFASEQRASKRNGWMKLFTFTIPIHKIVQAERTIGTDRLNY